MVFASPSFGFSYLFLINTTTGMMQKQQSIIFRYSWSACWFRLMILHKQNGYTRESINTSAGASFSAPSQQAHTQRLTKTCPAEHPAQWRVVLFGQFRLRLWSRDATRSSHNQAAAPVTTLLVRGLSRGYLTDNPQPPWGHLCSVLIHTWMFQRT